MEKYLLKLAKQVEKFYLSNNHEPVHDKQLIQEITGMDEHLSCFFDCHDDGGIEIGRITYSNSNLAIEDLDIMNDVTLDVVHPYRTTPTWIR